MANPLRQGREATDDFGIWVAGMFGKDPNDGPWIEGVIPEARNLPQLG